MPGSVRCCGKIRRMSATVGADIESLCAKCGDVWHVVVAMVGTKVAKVQCKQCSGYHRHKSPAGAKAASSVARRPKAKPLRAGEGGGGTRSPAKPVIDPDKPTRSYKINETYQAGEQVQHLRFGVGVVESAAEPGKIAVLFDDGRKVLAVAKRTGLLTTANEIVRAARRASDAAGE